MKNKDIIITKTLYLRGPNIWTYRPVLEAWVDIGELEDYPSNLIPGFHQRLSSWLPSLIEHRCSPGVRGGFLSRVEEGTWAGHILEHVTLELQNLAGIPGGFGKAREAGPRGLYKVVVRADDERVSRAAIQTARDLILAAIRDEDFDLPATLATLSALVERYYLGPSTACIIEAAAKRRIPALRLNDGNLVQLGHASRQERIWTAESGRTSAIAQGIAHDKSLTKSLLEACGIPTPGGCSVKSLEEALEVAEDIGFPVVLKPCSANHGRGVFTNLNSRTEIEQVWRAVLAENEGAMVERFIPGQEHRLLVVGNRMVAACKGKTQCLIGDGRSSVLDLIELQINSDPRCGPEERYPLEPLVLEKEPIALFELQRQGLSPDSVPADGKEVLIQRQGNMTDDVTDEVHPHTARLAILAAQVVGLDIAGIDLVATDISQPLANQGAAVTEVNAGPGLLMHLKPATGQSRLVGEAIVELLFPAEAQGRIPLVGISGSQGKTLTARLLAHLLALDGHNVGLACSQGLYFGQRLVDKGDCANWAAGRKLLLNCNLNAVVIENGHTSILSEGLAYDRCQIGIVTNLDPDDLLPAFHINTSEQLSDVCRTQVDVVLPQGCALLNVDDEQVAKMAKFCDGEVMFFGRDPGHPLLKAHCAQGGRAVYIDAGQIILAKGTDATHLVQLEATSMAGIPDQQLDSILAASGAAWAMNLSPELIRAGLMSFQTHDLALTG
jgi:cyanophycin synthetase